jgi:predicted metalloendopeptidase
MKWMDKKTSRAARRKVKQLLYKVGQPDWAGKVSKLDEYYSDVSGRCDTLSNEPDNS